MTETPGMDAARENIVERVGDRWAERITEFSATGTVTYPHQSLDEALDAYAAAVSSARDAEWRAAVKAVSKSSADVVRPVGEEWAQERQSVGDGRVGVHDPHLFRLAQRSAHAALTALLARMEDK